MFKILIIFVIFGLHDVCSGEKILVIPFFNTSLAMMANAIANRLAARGHSVAWLWPKGVSSGKILDNSKYVIIRQTNKYTRKFD